MLSLKHTTIFILFFFFLVSSTLANPKPTPNNITVIGSVFCDSCFDNTFSKQSYFLKGTTVQIQCRFKANSAAIITATRTTDQYGVYHLNLPPIHGFRCRQGKQKKSPCKATLIKSPSSSFCNRTGLQKSSTTHVAIKPVNTNLCILNLNALNYRPPKRDVSYCGSSVHNSSLSDSTSAFDISSLMFFWPLIPPFLLPWLHWPPLPFAFPPLPFPFNSIPLPDPLSLPFSLPPWLVPFLNPSSLPFPFSLFPPSSPPPFSPPQH